MSNLSGVFEVAFKIFDSPLDFLFKAWFLVFIVRVVIVLSDSDSG